MKTTKLILIAMSLSVLFLSCKKGSIWGVAGKGSNETQIQSVSGFSGIRLKTDADVLYTQDSIYYVEITAQKNILAVLETKVSGGDLTIDSKRQLWKHNGIRIIVHSPEIKRFTINGSGNIDVKNTLISSNVEFNIDGSGNINVPSVTFQTMMATIKGSGNLTINGGTTVSSTVNISGSGNISMLDMTCNVANVVISGSGKTSLNVSDQLTVDISGSGTVLYTGSATVKQNISGSGSVVHLN